MREEEGLQELWGGVVTVQVRNGGVLTMEAKIDQGLVHTWEGIFKNTNTASSQTVI